ARSGRRTSPWGDALAEVATEETIEQPTILRSDDDQVGGVVVCRLEQLIDRVSAPDAGLGGDATSLEEGDRFLEPGASLLDGSPVDLGEVLGRRRRDRHGS